MSGHSKWATTKHQKAAKDKVRGKLFAKLIRQVEVAAREGGGDLTANASLRTMYDKAREASVPLDTIERAIKRGTGELEGVTYESVTYEGYASNGVAVIVECLTDNRNRTTSEVKNVFTRNGGSLAEPGAVAWQFHRKGMIIVDKTSGVGEDELMLAALEAGAEDIADQGDTFDITTAPTDFTKVRDALTEAGITLGILRPHDGGQHRRAAGDGGRRPQGAPGARRPGGQRRRAERLRQLRHPRRDLPSRERGTAR